MGTARPMPTVTAIVTTLVLARQISSTFSRKFDKLLMLQIMATDSTRLAAG
jgi:hypothetical protein